MFPAVPPWHDVLWQSTGVVCVFGIRVGVPPGPRIPADIGPVGAVTGGRIQKKPFVSV
jgi:hypothetical protein